MSKSNDREKLLAAGLSVFHEQGFHGSGIQDVVKRAGVPKGSFYHYFESKNALGLAVLNGFWEAGHTARQKLQAGGPGALKRIDDYLAAAGYDDNGCLIGNFGSELAAVEEFRSRLMEIHEIRLSALTACIEEGQKDGTIRDDDKALSLAEFVIAGLEGAKLRAKVERAPAILKRYRRSIQLFLQSR
ncbi:MAG: TetR family transcriptional regulator C-terminal domain-containing protein [Burkholderiaceae bacterium]